MLILLNGSVPMPGTGNLDLSFTVPPLTGLTAYFEGAAGAVEWESADHHHQRPDLHDSLIRTARTDEAPQRAHAGTPRGLARSDVGAYVESHA